LVIYEVDLFVDVDEFVVVGCYGWVLGMIGGVVYFDGYCVVCVLY